MKQKISQKVLEYTVVFEPADEGGYIASVPTLPGCVTQGETFEEAVALVKDAIAGYLAVLEETGETIPQESKEVIVTKVAVHRPHLAL
ncbi:MAG: type II toxin-antitoxin system HicB family antitoxin [Patescibacteria group bacterium]